MGHSVVPMLLYGTHVNQERVHLQKEFCNLKKCLKTIALNLGPDIIELVLVCGQL